MIADPKPEPATASWTLLRLGGVCSLFTGVIVLLGWGLKIPLLVTMLPGLVPMRVNGGIEFTLVGISMCLLGVAPTRWRRLAQGIITGFVIALAAGTLFETFFDCDLGIDTEWWQVAIAGAKYPHPGRMGPDGALCFVLVGAALLVMRPSFWTYQRQVILRVIGFTVSAIGFFAIVGFVMNKAERFNWWSSAGMALHSSILLVIIGLCIAVPACKLKWMLGRGLTVAFAGGVFLLIVITLLTYHRIRHLTDAAEAVRHTQVILLEIHEIGVSVDDAVAAERGFVITGQEKFLEPFFAAIEELKQHRANLKILTDNDAKHQKQVAKLDSWVTALLVHNDTVIQARRSDGFDTASEFVSEGKGEALSVQIRKILSEIERDEDQILTDQENNVVAQDRKTLLFLPTGTIFSIALLVFGLFQLNSEATDRLQTEREVRESERRYRSLVVATSQMVWTTSATGKVVGTLPGWQAFTGQTDEEILGDGWMKALHPDEINQVMEAWKMAVARKLVFESEYRLRRHDGIYHDFAVRGVAVFAEDDTLREWVGTCIDITDRKTAEREIRKLNEELEQRVVERTAKLEAAVKELDSFSYSVSHDLRAPLRAIDGYSRMLEDDYQGSLDFEGIRMLRVVRSETQRMGQLIDDLLAFCRLNRQQVTPKDIDMRALAEAVFSELQLLGNSRKVDFKLGELCHTKGELAMLRQVWVNLLSNALKFTKHRELGIIEAGCRNESGETIYYVRDNGAGFDMAYANKLFGVFQRLHSESEFEGTGVGLALVQRIVSRHGGRVWGEGEVDKGATFYFSLPNS